MATILDEKELAISINSTSSSPLTSPTRPPPLFVPKSPYSTRNTSQCPTPTDEYDPTSTHPFSPFYSHPTTRTSFEQLRTTASQTVLEVYTPDVEAARSRTLIPGSEATSVMGLSLTATGTPSKESSVWPCQKQLVAKNREMKRQRMGCSPLARLSRRQRLWVKIVIALVIVGAATGIGVGVSRAVGGGVWRGDNQQGPIGR